MLIFVILSTTEAYFLKSLQSQPWQLYPCHHHSRARFCRLPIPPYPTPSHTIHSCSPSLPSYPPPKLPYRLPLRPSRRPFCPVFYSPCPLSPVSCPLSCPLSSSFSSPSPPAASPPQHYDGLRPISSSFTKYASYLKRPSENYKSQQFDDNHTNDIKNLTSLLHSPSPEKPEPTELLPSGQQFNQPSDTYLPSIINENVSIPSEQQLRRHGVKYLIKSNCSSNDSNCINDDFAVPPEVLKLNLFIFDLIH